MIEQGNVEAPVSDDVVHAESQTAWTDVVLATFRPRDHRVRDEEIFDILTTASGAESVAQLCAARGITLPTYCLWKAKYRHLSLDELRAARRRELWRARSLGAALLSGTIVLLVAVLVGLGRAAQASMPRMTEPVPHQVAAPAFVPPPPALSTPAVVQVPALAEQTAAPLSTSDVKPAPAPLPRSVPSAEAGYHVQVAAAETEEEGRALLQRLTAAGHHANVYRALVRDVEVFRVRVGPLETLPEAEEVATQLQRAGYSGAWVVR